MSQPALLPDLVDSHCHLTWPSFDEDRDGVIERMQSAGVRQAIVVSTGLDDARRAAEICKDQPGLFPTAGLHPNDLPEEHQRALSDLETLAREGGWVAIGETGLDYYRDRVPFDKQRAAFAAQTELARRLDLPVIVHIRDKEGRMAAYTDVARILEEHEGVRGVIHCYTGDVAHAERYLAAGFYISFSGILTFPKGDNVREAAASTPIERTLVETDAPFLAPRAYRGKRNEPSYVTEVAKALAPLKGLSEADVRRITSCNARSLFHLPSEVARGPAVYTIRDAVYVNVTNACDAKCHFCPRTHDLFDVSGYDLRRPKDPTVEEILEVLGDPGRFQEVVFCGFGEPTLRLNVVKEVARFAKAAGGSVRTRLNTNGHGDLVNRRPVAPELVGLIDEVSVSLNAQDRETYERHCPSAYSPDGFTPVLAWIRAARDAGLDVVCTALEGLDGVDVAACRRLAEVELGVRWRSRQLNVVG